MSDFQQIIDYDGNFVGDMTKFMRNNGFEEKGFEYNLVTVLGCQSSGKSTLLNELFGTKFEVMHAASGRSQTTKGLWMAADKKSEAQKKILVMDVEGTDSRERGEDRHTFEHRASLFALAVADLLVMNVWNHDVGRYGATNMGVLKTVFKVNLELFHSAADTASNPPPRTTILFVIRDFDGETPLHFLEKTLLEDVFKIWGEIKKPLGLETLSVNKLFEFKSVGLAKATSAATKEEFQRGVESLRDSMVKYWLPPRYSRNIPADGLGPFISSVWKAILESSDLDIPSQRRLLAEYRCEEIKMQVLQKIIPQFEALKVEVADGDVADVGSRVNDLFSTAIYDFDLVAVRYDPVEVYHEKRNSLIKQLINEASKPINLHFTHVKTRLALEAKNELESEVMRRKLDGSLQSKLLLWADLPEVLKTWAFKYDEVFSVAAESTALAIPPPADASAAAMIENQPFDVENIQAALRESLEGIAGIVTADEKALARQVMHKEVSFLLAKDVLDDLLSSNPNATKVEIWTEIGVLVKETREKVHSLFTDVWEGLDFENTTLNEAVAMSMMAALRSWAETASATLEARIVERFRIIFQRDSQGIPRHWPKMKVEEVTEVFKQAQTKALELLDIVEQISLPPSVFIQPAPKGEAQQPPPQVLISDLTKKVLESAKRQTITNKANGTMEQICRDALILQATGGAPVNIPLWMWGVLLVLGWNELVSVLTSPFTLILLLIAGIIGAVAFYSGNTSLPLVLAKQGLQMAFTFLKPMLSQMDRALQHQPDLSSPVKKEQYVNVKREKQD
eukprot:GDKK01062096.1.p1 GENE.GDKK01062096.1~~GDKK01062096.1.p1  ORF type:complete len:802 (+),score=223.34 GDKK01062096.1:26-2407(+)